MSMVRGKDNTLGYVMAIKVWCGEKTAKSMIEKNSLTKRRMKCLKNRENQDIHQ